MQLADDDSFSTIDDEFTTTEHDRDLAEVDLLLGHLRHAFAYEPDGDPEGHAVGQPQLLAFGSRVPCLVEVVVEVFQFHRAVIRLNGEHLAKKALEPNIGIALLAWFIELNKPAVRILLDLRQFRYGYRVAAA